MFSFLAQSLTQSQPAATDRLESGQFLATGGTLRSPGGQVHLTLQSDGNLVLYQGSGPSHSGNSIWASNTSRLGAPPQFLIIQRDGNLVLHEGASPQQQGRAVWDSGTWQEGQPTRLVAQDDGNLVLYRVSDNRPVWASNTQGLGAGRSLTYIGTLEPGQYLPPGGQLVSPGGQVYLQVQDDGNLVLYQGSGSHDKGNPLWSSGTNRAGAQPQILEVQLDGNLVLYEGNSPAAKGRPVWDSGTWQERQPVRLAAQDDGNLVLYRVRDGKPVWATNTHGRADGRPPWYIDHIASGQYLPQHGFLVSAGLKVYLIVQDDGNLVLYRGSGPDDNHGPIWASSTSRAGAPQQFLMLQRDGNLVLYEGSTPERQGRAVWHSGTWHDQQPNRLVAQDDGNLVLYRISDNKPVWASNTDGRV